MADYYSILKKTIASLPESNGAARRSVYSRARTAIVNQLKAYEPPLSPSEITAEQLRLEESIRKVEAEAARESLGLGPVVPKTETPASQPAAAAAPPAVRQEPAAVEPAGEPAPAEQASAQGPASPEADIPSPLKDTLSEAQSLGTAANQAVQNAKDAVEPAIDQSSQSVQRASSERLEPAFDDRSAADDGLFEPDSFDEQSAYDGAEETAPKGKAGKNGRARRDRPSASDALREGAGSRTVPFAIAGVLVLVLLGAGVYFFLPSGDKAADSGAGTVSTPAETASTPQPAEEELVAAPAGTPDEAETSKNTDRLLNDGEAEVVAPDARTVTTTTITPQEPPASDADGTPVVANAENEPSPLAPEAPLDAIDTPALVGEPAAVPQDNLTAIAPEEATPSETAEGLDPGVQRSILYEEGEDTGGAGTAAQGAVVWSVEEETDLDGKAQAVLSASVEIPERDVKVDIRIKPNDDTSLPASHLVEIKYEFPETFAAGDVVNVPGLVMKPTEEARGDALIGASVKVSPGFFWIALSSLPNEQQRNLALLRERGWIDIPMLYENGKRGILTLEKGNAGNEAVEKAISAWQAG
ncbi:hypothetical protein [Roseibium marinum]|uniref:CheA signal transduction histidine kinase n=1 Tax=Roseibium marinum TaxID=281252 RepID=A0A2S3UL69_9HYPH|nr:hypothetical protein [Roseibium marinum]POF28446.1 hypothetical protein CLV41_1137 [Roseibium marinum]